ncbi:heavy metal translocating P-type ATPase [Microbacterium marinum]|uniref:heavy metal translocating P-type ATPase n=1 Tax=Microbacterium marinum TaxID=421115 RepID=UPI003850FD68
MCVLRARRDRGGGAVSEECCGPVVPQKRIHRVQLPNPPGVGGDDLCCAPAQVVRESETHPGGDACCGPDERPGVVGEEPGNRPVWWRDTALLPSAAAGVFLLVGYILEWSGVDVPAVVLLWASLLAGASTFVPGAVRRLIRGRLGVGLLMTIAAAGAVTLGHVGEAATLAFLFSLAEALEDRAMDRAKEGLRALLSLIPETVRVSRLSGDELVPAAAVRELDVLIVGAGERVATDGVVVEGRSSLDTSAITGESIPVEVGPGTAVAAGSINGAATLRIEATAGGSDNSLTQIVGLVEQAHARKGERAQLADRIARPLVPAVLLAAALVALFGLLVGDPWTWVERALVVLVAASPCALAIAVPVTVISAIGSASKFGVVIKSGEAFEQLGTIRTVAFDKTGTLTRNEPTVVDVRPARGYSREDILAWAAAVESSSTHPLATAITSASPTIEPVRDVVEHAGHGITGFVRGRRVRVGNVRWLKPGKLARAADDMAGQGMTVIVVETDNTVVGLVGVRDELRPESTETVRLLHEQGITTVMLTGDNSRTATALARDAGITDVRAEQLPADKAAAISNLITSRPTAMVGDGINDAPALATATVGIAMGVKGSAAAVESADVAFTGRDLRLIPGALAHARRGRRIMTTNIGLALAIIIVLFPLALTGVLELAGVVLVHEIAEVVIILNGIRAARGSGPRQASTPTPSRATTLATSRLV